MSAIAGIYYLDSRPMEQADLKRMTRKLAHRGPDGENIWHKGSVGFGHRMLWTTPESLKENLPLVHKTGKFVITADARIDNRDELIHTFNLESYPEHEITDSELILASYEKWDESCPEKLVGDFAFVIWDENKQRLFCARDPMGIKPFYYNRSDRMFVFASEIKAIFCLQNMSREINELMIAFYLARVFEDRHITSYRNIYRLPAAHTLSVSCNNIQLKSYFSLNTSYEMRLSSDKEYAEAFREVFTEAVRCRSRSAFPIGSTLSGGLDSSSIACTTRNLLKEKNVCLHTFSAIFPGLPEEDLIKIDEREYINSVVSMGGFEPHLVNADRIGPLTEIKQLLQHIDDPFIGPNMYMHWALYNSVKQTNIRVFLDGIDGDTTVSYGFDYITDLARSFRWKKLFIEAKAFSTIHNSPLWKFIWHFGFRPLAPESVMKLIRTVRGRKDPEVLSDTVINPVFAKHVKLEERIKSLSNNGSLLPQTARDKHRYSLNSALHQYALEMLDKTAAAFSIEARYPFFDRRLIEFCLALPFEQKFHNGWTRAVLRKSMDGILPEKVRLRTGKANLSPNFHRKLLHFGKEVLEEVISDKTLLIEKYIDIKALRESFYRFARQPLHSEKEALIVYGAVTLALWLRYTNITQQTE